MLIIRRRAGTALLAALLLLATPAGPALGAAARPRPRASFTQIQGALMCVTCHEPLAEARSPQAYSENADLRRHIAQGETRSQVLRSMVADYGPAVLAKPPASGFNLLIYVIPPVVVLIGLVTLAVTIPRWRRRAREAAERPTPGGPAPLTPEDARRLDSELARRR